jgi:hypothetical protein
MGQWVNWLRITHTCVQEALNVLQLKDGKYQADLTIQMAEDLLPPEISAKVKNVVQNCRNAGDGKLRLGQVF